MISFVWSLIPQEKTSAFHLPKNWNFTSICVLFPCMIGFLDDLIVELLSYIMVVHLLWVANFLQHPSHSHALTSTWSCCHKLCFSCWQCNHLLFPCRSRYQSTIHHKHIARCTLSIINVTGIFNVSVNQQFLFTPSFYRTCPTPWFRSSNWEPFWLFACVIR